MKNYYYSDGTSKPVGPVSLDELDALFARRIISQATPVIGEGDGKWSDYQSIPRAKALDAGPQAKGTRYDPNVVQKFADMLYSRADFIVVMYVLIFVLLGAVIGGVALGALMSSIRFGAVGLLAGALLGGLVGYAAGQSKAFVLRLQAQCALCMIQIEKNTR